MKTIQASDYGIKQGTDITEQLKNLLCDLRDIPEEKTVVFKKGTYYIDSQLCSQYKLFITNTVGDKEFSADETPHLNAVPFYLGGLENLTLDGGDSVFIIDGKVTNIALEDCKNITLQNIEIRHAHPDMHELHIVKKSLFSVDFEIDRDTQYKFEKGKMYFFGKDYSSAVDRNAKNAFWIGLIRKDTPEKIERVHHPLFSALRVRDMGNNRRIRVTYPFTHRFKMNDRYYIFDVRRQFAGIFINRSENIQLKNIKQRFNYSLALVAQDSENISMEKSAFAPEQGSSRKMASVADFIQICNCRGRFAAVNCYFDGAGDDCLNVHGIHFKIVEKRDKTITVRFMHPQSHGFNPLRVGDTIAFINPQSLLEKGTAKIRASELLNETDIRLTLDDAQGAAVNGVIEDISACPDVEFSHNTLTRIITRGLLLTTRGKVNIEGNHFISNTMSGILLSDDAKSWYESGMCKDVTIKNNVFEYCGQTPILIKPENSVHEGYVHSNIKIIGNTFKKYSGACIKIKSSEKIQISQNMFQNGKPLITTNCDGVLSD